MKPDVCRTLSSTPPSRGVAPVVLPEINATIIRRRGFVVAGTCWDGSRALRVGGSEWRYATRAGRRCGTAGGAQSPTSPTAMGFTTDSGWVGAPDDSQETGDAETAARRQGNSTILVAIWSHARGVKGNSSCAIAESGCGRTVCLAEVLGMSTDRVLQQLHAEGARSEVRQPCVSLASALRQHGHDFLDRVVAGVEGRPGRPGPPTRSTDQLPPDRSGSARRLRYWNRLAARRLIEWTHTRRRAV